MTYPTDYDARKALPIYTGVLKYFPDAIAAVAHCSKIGNDQHNPGEPLHWAREKSTDELNTCARHLIEAGTIDVDGVRHLAKAAWRALAALQKEIEADGGKIHGEPRDPRVTDAAGEDSIEADFHADPSIESSPAPAFPGETGRLAPGSYHRVCVRCTCYVPDESETQLCDACLSGSATHEPDCILEHIPIPSGRRVAGVDAGAGPGPDEPYNHFGAREAVTAVEASTAPAPFDACPHGHPIGEPCARCPGGWTRRA